MLSIDPTIACYGNFPQSIVNYLWIFSIVTILTQVEACHATAYFPMQNCRQQSFRHRVAILRTLAAISIPKPKHCSSHFIFSFMLHFCYTIIGMWSNPYVLWDFPSINCQWSTNQIIIIVLYKSLRQCILLCKIVDNNFPTPSTFLEHRMR